VGKSGEFVVFYESDSQFWKQDPKKEQHGVDKYWVASEKNHALEASNNLHT
jgi:hypothetical protein